MEIIIDEELQKLLLPLKKEELHILEESIISEGCRDPLVLWGNTLIDGHNRYEICKRHNIEFGVVGRIFKNKDAVIAWMEENQLGRRNLKPSQLKLLLGRKYNRMKKQGQRNDLTSGQNDQKLETSEVIAQGAGVSEKTVRRAGAMASDIDNNGSDDLIDCVEHGNVSLEDAGKLAFRDEAEQIEIVEKINNGTKTTAAIREYKKDHLEENAADLPTDTYRVIYADPPWSYNDKQGGSISDSYGGAEKHYPSMSISELCDLPIKEMTNDDAVLFMWVTSPLLQEGFKVIESWGFKYKSAFIWDKVKHNMGHYNSVRHELLLICTRGSCVPDEAKLFDSVQSIERTNKHSEKPEEFRTIIDTLYKHGKKIELFARGNIPNGWNTWGNEIND